MEIFGSIISVVGNSTVEIIGLFVHQKSHKTYHEKQPNNSLEKLIWKTLRIPQNRSE